MYLTTHVAIGALIAEQIPHHPVLAFSLAVLAHFLADMIPHGDARMYREYIVGTHVRRAVAKVVLDSSIAILFILFIFNSPWFLERETLSWGIVGSVLPDVLVALYEISHAKQLRPYERFHRFIHNSVVNRVGDVSFATGFAMQMVFFAGLLSLIG